MKKKYYVNLIGIIVIALAIYFGLKSIDIKIEIENSISDIPGPSITINDSLTEKLYQDKLKEYQDWGYANGLIMAKRALRENEQLIELGIESKSLNCRELVEKLYELGREDSLKRPD